MNIHIRYDDDGWSTARGWKILIKKAFGRAAIVFVIITMGAYLIWRDLAVALTAMLALYFFAGSVVGCALGYAVGRKLTEHSGLEGGKILLPVLGMILTAELAAFITAGFLRHGTGLLLLVPFGGLVLFSAVVCAITILME